MLMWGDTSHKWPTLIEPMKIRSFFWNFLCILYLCQNLTKSTSAIYHSIARNLLYKILYRPLVGHSIIKTKKFEIQKFTADFQKTFFRVFAQKGTMIRRAQKNKHGFWKPVKNYIFWCINRMKTTLPGSESFQNKCDH